LLTVTIRSSLEDNRSVHKRGEINIVLVINSKSALRSRINGKFRGLIIVIGLALKNLKKEKREKEKMLVVIIKF
jgi:hypothetical protein